jgi:hypothetical protein
MSFYNWDWHIKGYTWLSVLKETIPIHPALHQAPSCGRPWAYFFRNSSTQYSHKYNCRIVTTPSNPTLCVCLFIYLFIYFPFKRVHAGSWANPALCSVGEGILYQGGRSAEAWSWPLTLVSCRVNGADKPLLTHIPSQCVIYIYIYIYNAPLWNIYIYTCGARSGAVGWGTAL